MTFGNRWCSILCSLLYICSCNSGFIIDVDGRRCDDIDECSDGIHSCQQVCNNTQGSHHCLCHDGYQLNNDNYSCRDLDECANGVDGCDQNCHNNVGSYTCSCNPGFIPNGDGLHCDDINECESGHHNCIEVCLNTDGSFECTCNEGYMLSSNGSQCNDVDECATGQNECDQNCHNTIGSYICSCNNGYTLNQDSIHCNDVDECAQEVDRCQQVCVNRNGSYTCDCNEGYEFVSGSAYACQDINECDPSIAVCEQICMNSNGSYTCDCLPGYSRTSDQLSCLGPLINVTLTPTSSRTLTLSWCPPIDPERRHGDVLRYPIVCISEDNPGSTFIANSQSDEREVVLQGLLPYNTYNCCVSVQTTLANSTAACQTAQTLEEAPGSPPAGVVLGNQNPYRISVFWNPPNIPNGVITRYIIYAGYENGSVDVFYMNGKSTAYNISNLYPFQIIGVKISAGTIIGEGPRTPRMEVQTAQTPPSQVRNVVVDVISNSRILVRWDPPARPNGILTFYDVVVYNERTGFHTSREIHSLERQQATIHGLRVFIPYTVQVFASTTAGRGTPVTITVFTGHGVPAVPTLLSVERISAISSRINWVPLTPDEAKGVLTNLEIAYEPVRLKGCNNFNPMDSEAVYETENLFEQSTAIVSGLEPNREYCVAIKVSTSGGESGFSNSILISLAKRVPFQIRFPLSGDVHCSGFVAANSTGKIADISSAVSNAVTKLCQCHYQPRFLVDGRLLCSVDKNEVIFQSQLLTTNNKTAEEMRNLTQQWVFTEPLLSISNKTYLLDPYCSIVLDELGDTVCDAISPTDSEADIDEAKRRFTIYVLEIVSVAIFLLVLFATFAVIIYTIIRIQKRRSILLSSTEKECEVHGDYDDKKFDSLVATTTFDSDPSADCHKL